jgi:short subunit dehydrogenase-like uncharacterized protein
MKLKGPTEAERRSVKSEVWGELKDAEGNRVIGNVFTPDAYTFTGLICLKAAEILSAPHQVPSGVSFKKHEMGIHSFCKNDLNSFFF